MVSRPRRTSRIPLSAQEQQAIDGVADFDRWKAALAGKLFVASCEL